MGVDNPIGWLPNDLNRRQPSRFKERLVRIHPMTLAVAGITLCHFQDSARPQVEGLGSRHLFASGGSGQKDFFEMASMEETMAQ